jgi:hypothetical protein
MRAGVVAVAVGMLVGTSALAADKAGYVLLDKMVTQLDQMADARKTTAAEATAMLNELMALAKQAKAEERIDETFFRRYTRVLAVLRLVAIEDKERILVPFIERELTQFVKDVTGATVTEKALPFEVAKAITKELDDLKSYLDAR